jgi:hypothetical protein
VNNGGIAAAAHARRVGVLMETPGDAAVSRLFLLRRKT